MAALTYEELRVRALALIDAIELETPGIGVLVVLAQQLSEDGRTRFAAETNYGKAGAVEISRLVARAFEAA